MSAIGGHGVDLLAVLQDVDNANVGIARCHSRGCNILASGTFANVRATMQADWAATGDLQ